MKKIVRRAFAILMTFVIAITMIPTMEVKAAEGDESTISITDVTMTSVGEELESGDTITVSATIVGENLNESSIKAIFWASTGDAYGYYMTKVSEDSNTYQGTITIDGDHWFGKEWYLKFVLVEDTSGTSTCYDPAEDGYYYNVKVKDENGSYTPKTYDNITVIVMDENGEWDDSVDRVECDGVKPLTSLSDLLGTDYVEPESEELGEFLGWSINDSEKLYQKDDTFVVDGDWSEFRIMPVFENKAIEVRAAYVDEDGEIAGFYETLYFPRQEEVRYQDIIDRLPEVKSMEGLTFVEWEVCYGYELTDVVTDTYADFEAVYQENFIYVNRCVYDEDWGAGYWTGGQAYILEEEITYGELLEKYPVAENIFGCTFLNWEYDEEYDLTANVSNGDYIYMYAVYDKALVEVCLKSMTKDGNWDNEYEYYGVKNNATYADLLAILPEPETVDGCEFKKWTLDENVNLTDPIDFDRTVWVYAEYDSYPVEILRVYVDKNGEVVTEEIKEIYPAGTKIEDILDKYKVSPDNASDESFAWIESYEPGEISIYNNYISLIADYEENMLVRFYLHYIGQSDGYGIVKDFGDYFLVNKSICEDESDLRKYFEETIIPSLNINHFSGYQFEEYYIGVYKENGDDNEYYNAVSVESGYDTSEVIRVEMEIGAGEDYEYRSYVVEAGDIISLPTEYAGYYLTWEGYDNQKYEEITITDNKFVVPSDAKAGDVFELEAENGDKVSSQVTPPADNTPTDKPSADNTPGETTPPNIADNQQGGTNQPDNTNNNVPNTADTTTAIPYVTLLLLGAGVILVGNKKRNFSK